MDFKDQVVVITGAGSGIGRATAHHFHAHGARLVLSDIDLASVEALAEELGGGERMLTVAADVSDHAAVEALYHTTRQTFGQLDVSIHNAGIGPQSMQKAAQHALEDWHQVIAVNQTGVFYCMQQALLLMEAQGHGNIVNVASLAGLIPSAKMLAYSASKFAVVGMTKSAALEYGGRNIRINAVCPGYTHSKLLDRTLAAHEDMEEYLLKLTPMRRFGQATEVAEAIAWLASDRTQFITGQTITLDGGLSL